MLKITGKLMPEAKPMALSLWFTAFFISSRGQYTIFPLGYEEKLIYWKFWQLLSWNNVDNSIHSGPGSNGEYSSPHYMIPAQHHYKTYTQPAPKYQSILGALKSLFGGSDAAPSASHYPIYFSPSPQHHGPYTSASSPVGTASAPPYYYSG